MCKVQQTNVESKLFPTAHTPQPHFLAATSFLWFRHFSDEKNHCFFDLSHGYANPSTVAKFFLYDTIAVFQSI